MEKISNILFYRTILILSFILGVFLLIKPQSNISEYHNKNITVINIKKDDNFPINKIIGSVLILSTIFGFIILNKTSQNSKNEDSKIIFTNQEEKIYELLKKGHTNKEIASELYISISTVKTHINNIFKKLNISSRNQLPD